MCQEHQSKTVTHELVSIVTGGGTATSAQHDGALANLHLSLCRPREVPFSSADIS